MRTSTRLFFSLAVPILLVMVLFGVLDLRRSRVLLRAEQAREGRAVAMAMRVAVEDALRDRQLTDVQRLVDRLSGYESVLGVRIFDAAGRVTYQSAGLSAYPFAHSEALQRVLSAEPRAMTYRHVGEEPVVTFIERLTSPDGALTGAIQVIQPESFIEKDAMQSRNSILALTSIMIVVTGIILFFVTHYSIGKPVAILTRSFREVGSGDLAARVPVRDHSEFGRLAVEFNRMCEQLEVAQSNLQGERAERQRVETRLQQAERLADLGRLAAGFAHEVGSPLNVISGRTESMLRILSGSGEAERNLRIIATQIDRIAGIVQGVLEFARARPPQLVRTQLSVVLSEVLEFLEDRLHGNGIELSLAFPADLEPIAVDPDQMHQVFLNLVLNAIDAMPEGGTLCVDVKRSHQPGPDGDGALHEVQSVTFTDTGIGIEAANVDRIFEPFFTTKDVGSGTGLGLAVCYGIIREHGGWIHVESQEGRGTQVSVHLRVKAPTGSRSEPAGRVA